MTDPVENQNKNKFCEFHGDKGHSTDECIHLRKQIEEADKKTYNDLHGPTLAMNDEAKDHPKLLRRERNLFLTPREKRWTRKPNCNRGGSRRASYPPHARRWRISLRGDGEHSTSITMNFMVVRSPLPYNSIIGHSSLRKIQAVPSIAYRMLKFPVERGIVTIRSNTVILAECGMITGAPSGPPPQEPTATEGIKVAIHLEYPELTIMIGSNLSEKGRMELCNLLKDSLDIFTWKLADMTGVPRSMAEHLLNFHEGC
ncbi:hypothetical protein Tco_1561867 [Tanacetum coccineum]